MLQIGTAIVMAIFGVWALMKGRLRVVGQRAITGQQAKIVGILAILPLLAVGLFYLIGGTGAIRTIQEAENISGAICWGQIIIIGIAILMARRE